MFGDAVEEIKLAFLELEDEPLDDLLSDYGEIHGKSAEQYARKTFLKWKRRTTELSGQTMERLIELVPPYLSPDQRFKLLTLVIVKHKKSGVYKSIRINVKKPNEGLAELKDALASMSHEDMLAHVPENIMNAAKWLYDDDITTARAMLAQADKVENEIVRANAKREIDLLERAISGGQVQSASYSVEMPAGKLSVVAYKPSACFIATECFGYDAPETELLREWRDDVLRKYVIGRRFIAWYYKNGEIIANYISASYCLKFSVTRCLVVFVNIISLDRRI